MWSQMADIVSQTVRCSVRSSSRKNSKLYVQFMAYMDVFTVQYTVMALLLTLDISFNNDYNIRCGFSYELQHFWTWHKT